MKTKDLIEGKVYRGYCSTIKDVIYILLYNKKGSSWVIEKTKQYFNHGGFSDSFISRYEEANQREINLLRSCMQNNCFIETSKIYELI